MPLCASILIAVLNAAPDAGSGSPQISSWHAEFLPLPGGPSPIGMDYIAYDPQTDRVWVPAGNTGKTVVVAASTGKMTTIDDFPTASMGTRTVGPSSATVGSKSVYIGNRADSTVCAVDKQTLKKGSCVKLESTPDGLAYVASVREVWVTTPRDNSLTILGPSDKAKGASVKTKIPLEGQPEGYAVDEARGLFITNLEDKDMTLLIDVRTGKVKSTLHPGCGKAGPRGLALDSARKQIFVACTDQVVVLAEGDGKILSQAPTGAGVDNIDYLPSRHQLFVASGKEGMLRVFQVSATGQLRPIASASTSVGGRSVLIDSKGNAFVPDSAGARLVIVRQPRSAHARAVSESDRQ